MTLSLLDSPPSSPAAWSSHVLTLDTETRWAVGEAIAREWISGRLEPRFVGAELGDSLVALRRALALALEASGVADELEIENRNVNPDESTARRWCWIRPWYLLSQDEDLMLMSDRLVVPLLEEAAHGCPKREDALSITQHHVRDQAHASLRAGPDALRARLRELAAFRPAAAAAKHATLDAYLGRLESYSKPARVDREEAAARISDLWRCHAPPKVELEPERAGEWRARYPWAGNRDACIVVERRTGAMRFDETDSKGGQSTRTR